MILTVSPFLTHILGFAALCSLTLQAAVNGDSTSTQRWNLGCEPSAERLDADATLSKRAGRYRLVLVADSSGASRRAVSGTLTLIRQTREPDPSSDITTPLFGYTDIDPGSVGAHRVGDPGSKAPTAPGVLVIERQEYGRRMITLRLGSLANRRDLVRYDGAYTALRVLKIDEDGFSGSWRSGGGSGLDLEVTTGYFCAWKVR